jgi:dTDP-glucose pyrophosphorylase
MNVCILAAGMGTRVGPTGDFLHKALLPLGNRAVLSHLFDRFPKGTRFTIAVGNKASQIEAFVSLVHPEVDVQFVTVDPFTGPGSGPGRSLLCCKPYLSEPFAFIACDTLISNELPPFEGNWLGVTPVTDPGNWCTVLEDAEGKVRSLQYKDPQSPAKLAFTGLSFIEDVQTFWDGLEAGMQSSGECQVNAGLNALIAQGLRTYPVEWADTGTWENYLETAKRFEKNLTFVGKTTEITYRYGEAILKLYPTEDQAQRCERRGQQMGDAVPRILGRQGPVVSFQFIAGKLLSDELNATSCRSFLDWAQTFFWRDQAVDEASFQAATRAFYVDKTLQRVRQFEQAVPEEEARYHQPFTVQGRVCAPVGQLLESIQMELVDGALASTLHGDLHGDNILVGPQGYQLIDWRDSYAGLEVGDRYYDLAKFLHTLDLTVHTMDQRLFDLQVSENQVRFSHQCEYAVIQARDAFWEFVQAHGYDRHRIEILNALVFLNMAPLYDRQLGAYLYWLGRYQLSTVLAPLGLPVQLKNGNPSPP